MSTAGSMVQAFRSYFDLLMANSRELKNECYYLRWQVYCQELGYENPYRHDDLREVDESDEQAVHTLLRHRKTGIAAGTARLVLADAEEPAKPFPIETAAQESFFLLIGRSEQLGPGTNWRRSPGSRYLLLSVGGLESAILPKASALRLFIRIVCSRELARGAVFLISPLVWLPGPFE